jgi:hypothetical protein
VGAAAGAVRAAWRAESGSLEATIAAHHRCAGAATAVNAAMNTNKPRAQTKSDDLVVLTRTIFFFILIARG